MKNDLKSKECVVTFKCSADFLSIVDSCAESEGLSRSNFLRNSIARAITDAGYSLPESEVVSFRGQRTDRATKHGKLIADGKIAGARAVRLSRKTNCEERVHLEKMGLCDEAIDLFIFAKTNAEYVKKRTLTRAERDEFLENAMQFSRDRARQNEVERRIDSGEWRV